jgi:glutamate transport system substrate-binding protein
MVDPQGSGRSVPLSRRPWPVRRRPDPARGGTAEDIVARDLGDPEIVESPPPPPPPPPPGSGEERTVETAPAGFDLAAVRLAALGLALVLTLAIALVRLLVGGPPSVDQLRSQAGVDGWSELTVGVKVDQPGTAFYDKDTKIWSGFDIDIAYMIAEDLGFRRDEVRFYGIESEDRARMQAVDGQGNRVPVKLVIASYSYTQARDDVPGVTFSKPYLYTEQSVVTLADHDKVSTFDDLAHKKVCTISTSTSETALDRAQAVPVRRNLMKECFDALDSGDVEAVSTDAAILAGFVYRDPGKYKHSDLGLDTTEAWGVNVGENEALKTLVNLTFYRSLKDPRDHRWEDAYQRNLQVEVKSNGPTPIAVAGQPDVPRPDVRELPWEDTLHD